MEAPRPVRLSSGAAGFGLAAGLQGMMFADLHLHSSFSDGTFTPEQIVALARSHHLQALALTDHDTVEGCARAAAACAAAGLEFITGVELTAELESYEVHLLGYFVDPTDSRLLTELAKFQAVRQNRIREMVGRLNELGIPLPAERVFALAHCHSPGRPHVARALVEEGHCGDLDEAFERFLKRGRPAWVPKFRISVADAIALLQGAGGLAVVAHPGLNRTDEVLEELVAAGVDGIECFHTKHSTVMNERYLELADRHHLLVTGGSDCHGTSKGRSLIGTIKLPYSHVEQMKAKVLQRAAHRGFLLAGGPAPLSGS